jgi:hypothetical protein
VALESLFTVVDVTVLDCFSGSTNGAGRHSEMGQVGIVDEQ